MAEAEAEVQDRAKTNSLAIWLAIMGLALIVPLFPLQQVTGPIINALLFIAVVILGLRQALVICFVPSLMALSAGLLLPILAPIVPFIMVSNVILVVTFNYLWRINFAWGVVIASLLKFIFIWSTTSATANLFIKNQIAIKTVANMMSWPQLVSALAGGVLAYGFLKFIKRI
ncbi:MAG: iron hydrogenase [Patescibacteria group bacterium]